MHVVSYIFLSMRVLSPFSLSLSLSFGFFPHFDEQLRHDGWLKTHTTKDTTEDINAHKNALTLSRRTNLSINRLYT